MSGWTGGSAWVWPVVLVAGLILLAVGLVMLRHSSRAAHSTTEVRPPEGAVSSARAVLDDRLARGEIDVAEYQRRAAVLDER